MPFDHASHYLLVTESLPRASSTFYCFLTGSPSPLGSTADSVRRFCAWQRQGESEDAQPNSAYWKQQPDAAPPVLGLPKHHPHPLFKLSVAREKPDISPNRRAGEP